jgi:multidrug efflux pump subunit AcrA (membrane-fusion protein)
MNKDTPITIPITAIKFTDTTGSVFVVENEKLVARPVVLGTVSGSMVTVLEGIDATTPFVVDARGKTAGESVLVITN